MNINIKLIPILKKINFTKRYLNLCEEYYNYDNCLSNIDIEKVNDLLKSKTLNFRYQKNERFFKLKEKFDNYEFQFNIIIKNGCVQFVWHIKENAETLKLGWGMWENIVEEIMLEEFQIKPRPYFSNYEDLHLILKEAFNIYEDFKAELVKNQ